MSIRQLNPHYQRQNRHMQNLNKDYILTSALTPDGGLINGVRALSLWHYILIKIIFTVFQLILAVLQCNYMTCDM